MNDKQMECFIAVAKTLNFTEAAEMVFSTQPTISRLISSLEDELGMALLYRTNKEVRLTPAGSIIYALFLSLRDEFDEKVAMAHNVDRGIEGTVRLDLASETELDILWDKIIPEFQELHPQIDFVYECNVPKVINDRLLNNETDLAIVIMDNDIDAAKLKCDPIITTHMFLVCGKTHPLAKAGWLDPDILEDSVIWTIFSEKKQAEIVSRLYDYLGVRSWKIHHTDDGNTNRINVRMGNGILFMDPITQKLDEDNYVCFPLPEEYSEVPFSAVWKSDNINPALAMFLEFLHENVVNETR